MEKSNNIMDNFINKSKYRESRYNDILKDLQNANDNLELKTEVKKPIHLSIAKVYSDMLIDEGYINIGNFLNNYIDILLRYRISEKRQSRKEIISAIISMEQKTEPELNIAKEFTKNLK